MSVHGSLEEIGVLRLAMARIEGAGHAGVPAFSGRAQRKAAVTLGQGTMLDAVLQAGIGRGALHEIVAASPGDAAAASGFALALAARFAAARAGPVVWIVEDHAKAETGAPYAPGLAAHGIDPAHLILVEAANGQDGLWAMEEALKCKGVSAVVGEIWRLKSYNLAASRRLVLAAQKSGTPALMVPAGAAGAAQAMSSAARTRFEVKATSSAARAWSEVKATSSAARAWSEVKATSSAAQAWSEVKATSSAARAWSEVKATSSAAREWSEVKATSSAARAWSEVKATSSAAQAWSEVKATSSAAQAWSEVKATSSAAQAWSEVKATSSAAQAWSEVKAMSGAAQAWSEVKATSSAAQAWSEVKAMSGAARTRFELKAMPGPHPASASQRIPPPGRAAWEVRVARIRAGPDTFALDHNRFWPVLWDHEEACFRDALSLPLSAPSRDRPDRPRPRVDFAWPRARTA